VKKSMQTYAIYCSPDDNVEILREALG
jgi:hypothetical protein